MFAALLPGHPTLLRDCSPSPWQPPWQLRLAAPALSAGGGHICSQCFGARLRPANRPFRQAHSCRAVHSATLQVTDRGYAIRRDSCRTRW